MEVAGDRTASRSRREWRWAWLVLAGLAAIYVLNAFTPSHYGETSRNLGIARSGPVLFRAQPIRSDEWAVSTPYFQIAVANDLGPVNRASPYQEPLKAFFALPSRDWSMAFKPDLWGFLALPPAHAFSLHYVTLALAMLGGMAIFLRQVGCGGGVALAGAALLCLSQYVQVWWTSNAPVLAWAVWPAVIFLWRGPWWARAPLLTYAVAVWIIGQLYPPFILAAGLAMGVAILALRPDALRGRNLVPGLLAVAVGLGIVWLHYADLIPVMADTVYPGRRVSDGGGIELLQVVAHAFPYLLTNLFDPLPELWGTNACEVAVVGSFLPLALATFGDHRALAGWARAHWRALAIWGLGLAVMAAWMLAPVPGRYAPLLNMIPPNRMLWGFGLLSALGLIRLVAVAPFVLTWLRTTLFLGGVVAAWFVSKVVISDTPPELDRFDLLVAFPLIGLLVLRWRWPALLPPRRLVLLALAVTAAGTFGQFNPVQSARPIFERRPSAFLDALEDYAAAHPRGWVVVDGHFGAILNGAGLPAINHVLLQPQLDFFRAAYPDMAPDAFDQTFNRYAHVMLEPQAEPSVRQLDLVAIPPDPFGIPLPIRTLDAPPAGVAGGKVTALRTGERTWRVTLSGEGPWRGVRPDHALGLAMAPGVGRIVSASAYRLARPDLVESRKDRLAFAAGYGARIDVELAEMAAKFPTGAIAAVPLGD